jgi:hypothetical protein
MQTGFQLRRDSRGTPRRRFVELHVVIASMRVRGLIRPLWGINLALAALVISAAAAAGLFVGSDILLPGQKFSIATWARPVVDGAGVPPDGPLRGRVACSLVRLTLTALPASGLAMQKLARP